MGMGLQMVDFGSCCEGSAFEIGTDDGNVWEMTVQIPSSQLVDLTSQADEIQEAEAEVVGVIEMGKDFQVMFRQGALGGGTNLLGTVISIAQLI